LGVKGVGEVGTIPVAAAIISAIEHALTPLNIHITETPILPERLFALINQARSTTRPAA
jgi:carbon-monoxide dehydrogenase large subunit